jgi:hypothetical protein
LAHIQLKKTGDLKAMVWKHKTDIYILTGINPTEHAGATKF